MAVRWPDGSYTGSVKAETPEPAPVEPDPEKQIEEKKEGHNAHR